MALTNKTHRVQLVRDTMIKFPELWLEVYVHGPKWEEKAFAEMFSRARCSRAESPEQADLVIFPGGEDVNPALYNESSFHPSTSCNDKQDKSDIQVFAKCYELGIPMFGVCRGAQFGWVMHGGRLYQDVDGHMGDHSMFDIKSHIDILRVSSVHHQMCYPSDSIGAEILAVSRGVSSKRYLNAKEFDEDDAEDIEAFFFRDTCFFGVQGHPEYRGYHNYMKWCLKQIQELMVESVDLEFRDNKMRIKQDTLDQRTAKTIKELA